LKSNAAHIGKPQLQKIAADLERSLSDGENKLTSELMRLFETELDAVLRELEPLLLDPADVAQTDASAENTANAAEALQLLEQLEPLLRRGNPHCLNYIESLRGVPGSEKLMQQMNDFKFKQALGSLAELKRELEEK
jgi:HPt (histidine-containing phosphotransfer) domain-containing protein